MKHSIPRWYIPDGPIVLGDETAKEIAAELEIDQRVHTTEPADKTCPYCGESYLGVEWTSADDVDGEYISAFVHDEMMLQTGDPTKGGRREILQSCAPNGEPPAPKR